MFCPKCGKEIKDGSKFCPFCGGAIAPENTAPQPGQKGPDFAPPDPSPMGETEPFTQAPGAADPFGSTEPYAYGQDGGPFTAGAPEGGKKSKQAGKPPREGKRRTGLIVGCLAGAAAVLAAVGIVFALLFSSPKVRLEKALLKSANAYSDARKELGLPDLNQLYKDKSFTQSLSLELGSFNEYLTGGEDLSYLSGLGLRAGLDYDRKSEKMGLEVKAFLGGDDILSGQLAADGNEVGLASPQITRGKSYGVNTKTLGADLVRMGADDSTGELGQIGFNLFDLVDKMTLTDSQTEEMQQAIEDANKQLLKEMDVEKDGKDKIEVNGEDVNAVHYRVTISEDAIREYLDALEDAMGTVDTREKVRDVLEAMGFDKSRVNDMLDEMGDMDVYGQAFDTLKQGVKELGDLELDAYVHGGYVVAAEWSEKLEGTKCAIGLYLGGGDSYVDDWSARVEIDGEELLSMSSSGDHACKKGEYTDKTELRVRAGYGDDVRLTFETSFEPEAKGDNFEWEMNVNNTATVSAKGQVTAGEDSIDVQLDDVAVKAAGVKLLTLKAGCYVGPFKGVSFDVSSPVMLTDMAEDEFDDLFDELQDNAGEWAYDMRNLLPEDLYDYLF